MSQKLPVLHNQPNEHKPWYAAGLRFKCTECGQCCTGAPGYVWVSDEEIIAMAEHLKLPLEEFVPRYLRLVNGRYALLERPVSPTTYDCIFLKNKKCSVYTVRPRQCRTFPWWQHNLDSPEDWRAAASYCEGISEEAPIVPLTTITEQLNQNEK